PCSLVLPSVRCADIGQYCCDTAAQEMKRISLRRSLSLRVGTGKAQKVVLEKVVPSTAPGEGSSGKAHRQRSAKETQATTAEPQEKQQQQQQQQPKNGMTIDAGDQDLDDREEDEDMPPQLAKLGDGNLSLRRARRVQSSRIRPEFPGAFEKIASQSHHGVLSRGPSGIRTAAAAG
ncbi:unnamed protein product, partial [Scytosiphon promiscuus]